MEEITKHPLWRDAIQVSKEIVEMCEDFSNQESNILLGHLRNSVIDIPAGVAADLAAGRQVSSEPLIRLVATIELIHAVYPAIDTAKVIEQLDAMKRRLAAPHQGV